MLITGLNTDVISGT